MCIHTLFRVPPPLDPGLSTASRSGVRLGREPTEPRRTAADVSYTSQERLAQALRERPEGATALDALREFILESLTAGGTRVLRKRVIAGDEALLNNHRARFAPMWQLTVEAIAEDLHTGPEDIRPQIVAAALAATFSAVHDPTAPPESLSPQHAMEVIDDVMRFLHGGLEALRHPSPAH
jgi:hypothetical protein